MVPLQGVFGSLPEGEIQDFRADRITGRGRSEARIDQCPDDQCQQHGFLGTHLDVGVPDFNRGIVAGESCCPPDMTLVQRRFGARLWSGYPHVDVEPGNILMRAGSGDEPLDLAVTLVLCDP